MGLTILVVDDQWSMQELARIVLQTAGYRVIVASDGAAGLSLARMERPRAIVLDYHLMGVSGTTLLAELRGDPHTCHIPIVCITADASTPRVVSGFRRGYLAFLRKPFHPTMLLTMLARVMRRNLPAAV